MRNLKFGDIKLASKILKKLHIRLDEQGKFSSPEQAGIGLMMVLAENMQHAEQEIAELMVSLIGDGMTIEKFIDLDIEQAMDYFEELSQQPGLQRFFKLLGNLK